MSDQMVYIPFLQSVTEEWHLAFSSMRDTAFKKQGFNMFSSAIVSVDCTHWIHKHFHNYSLKLFQLTFIYQFELIWPESAVQMGHSCYNHINAAIA